MHRDSTPGARAMGVLPDVTGVDRLFTYLVPDAMVSDLTEHMPPPPHGPCVSDIGDVGGEADRSGVAGASGPSQPTRRSIAGSIVRIDLAGRRVRAWVVDDEVAIPEGIELKPIESIVSLALSPTLVGLARFASWRYAGRLRPFLVAGSPDRNVCARDLAAARTQPGGRGYLAIELDDNDPVVVATRALCASGGGVLELPPNAARLSVVLAFLRDLAEHRNRGANGDLLVLVPERRDVETLARNLDGLDLARAVLPGEFAAAAAGDRVVIGTRNAAFGPVGKLGGVLVLDGHAESFDDQRAPNWNAVVVALERARRSGVPCIVTSPCPPLSITGERAPARLDAPHRRAHWPAIELIDRRGDDPRSGLYATTLGEIIRNALARDSRAVVCVLNRSGRLRLLGCNRCGEVARCTVCGGAMQQSARSVPGAAELLTCATCGATRPVICASCAATSLRVIRVGVARAAEELAALVGVPTRLVTGETRPRAEEVPGDERVLVGTEAVLHRVRSASLVVFLDFDQHLLAPRLAAAEEALALLALAGRLVGGRGHVRGGRLRRRLVVQSRLTDHAVLRAAVTGDPEIVWSGELDRRREAGLPPFSALALISGEESADAIEALMADPLLEVGPYDEVVATKGAPLGVRYLVRAPTTEVLCGALAAHRGLGPGVRIEVDPRTI